MSSSQMRVLIGILTMAVAAASCASTGAYREASGERGYGYYETRFDENRYRIQYRHRGDNLGEAQDYALLRASELTLERGYDWFQVIDRTSQVTEDTDVFADVRTERTITRDCGLLGCRTSVTPEYGVGATAGSRVNQEDSLVVIEIIMGAGPRPSSGNAYDAARLAASIRSRR